MSSTILTPTLPWWTVAGQTVSKAATGYLGAFLIIITLQGDSDSPVYVNEANKVKQKSSSADADYGTPSAEHTKNKNKLEKHQKANKPKNIDRGSEKGDTRRTRYK